jgi:hypothetical protein
MDGCLDGWMDGCGIEQTCESIQTVVDVMLRTPFSTDLKLTFTVVSL